MNRPDRNVLAVLVLQFVAWLTFGTIIGWWLPGILSP